VSTSIIGWDIGGVNTKVARVSEGTVREARTARFEIQRSLECLPDLLRRLAGELGPEPNAPHAVTMTAELSQRFRTKREGVHEILDAVERAFPDRSVHVYTTDGTFVDPRAARSEPLRVAASNWSATARVVAARWPTGVLIDIGTTTTDIIPIVDGRVVARGRTDPERLAAGELVYLGAIRTPVEAIVHQVPTPDGMAGVSAEGFALMGDVHLWRGEIQPVDYDAPTPDGRPATRELAGERLARIVCADREMLHDSAIDAIAAHVAGTAVSRIAGALERVRDRHPAISLAIVAGAGAFLAARGASRVGLAVVDLASELGGEASRAAPAAAVALLLERMLGA
jgi:probable H4MPT-linked C1 transfer pathway protein